MTTDITELAQSLKAAAEKATPGPWGVARDGKTLVSNQSHPIATVSDAMHRMLADGSTGKDAEFIALANPANVKRLVEALKKAQQQTTESENRVRKQNRHICELFDDNTALRQRISELESRTVKLPEPEEWNIIQILLCKKKVIAAIRAAGIKVEAE
nr:ead/Ea22-like family protein [Klebsiella pneumoniae]